MNIFTGGRALAVYLDADLLSPNKIWAHNLSKGAESVFSQVSSGYPRGYKGENEERPLLVFDAIGTSRVITFLEITQLDAVKI